MPDIDINELLALIAAQQDLIDDTTRRLESQQDIIDELRDDMRAVKQRLAYQVAQDALTQGLFPSRLEHVSLISVQIFHTKAEDLGVRQRQAGHTPWSLRIETFVGGRKIKKAVNLALYSGLEFARQVYNTDAMIPAVIDRVAETVRENDDLDGLFGMVRRLTKGEGTPRDRSQFGHLSGHLSDQPVVTLFVDDVTVTCQQWRPGAGSRKGRAIWYGTCKPNS